MLGGRDIAPVELARSGSIQPDADRTAEIRLLGALDIKQLLRLTYGRWVAMPPGCNE